jgi:DNA-binding NarL/FixJ family response regulator
MSRTLRVLIADDHRIIREGLCRLLESQDGFRVVGKAPDGATAVQMADALEPDLVLMDYEMPEKNGVEAIQEIRKSHPDMVVIAFSMHDDGSVEQAMLDAGAAVHVSKSRSTSELLSAIREHAGLGD